MIANRCPNPICEYFNRTLPNNAKVCVYCGKDLGNVVKPPDPPPGPPIEIEDEKTIVEKRSEDQKPIIIKPIYPIDPILPLLKLIHYSGREFQWSGEAGVIGRRSKKMNIALAIDLTGIPDEGIISRPHAQVTWDRTQKKYMILDLKSTNGTSLNGTSLNPGVQYPLMNSDLLQFGENDLVRFMVCVI